MNLILGDVEETVTTVVVDEETFEELVKVHILGTANRTGEGENGANGTHGAPFIVSYSS